MKLSDLQEKKILLVGYGQEGKFTEDFLQRKFPGITIGVADDVTAPQGFLEQKNYDLAIRSPGVNKERIKIPYTTATNIFFANTKSRIIGVTGTKGKSTTASLLYAMLRESRRSVSLAGNIGVPMLGLLDGENKDQSWCVVELSSYMLDDIQYSPSIAVVVNLYPDHLNYHGSLEAYYLAKRNILKFGGVDNLFVYQQGFPELDQWALSGSWQTVSAPTWSRYDHVETKLIGEHNRANIRLAVATVETLGVSSEAIEKAIREFKPLRHRSESIGEHVGIRWYDDAISTTPESTLMAIEAIPNIGCVLLGGFDRGYNFTALAKRIVELDIPSVVLFPDTGEKLAASLRQEGYQGLSFHTSSMVEAVGFAANNAPKGSAVILSTASPSYSLWKNFEAKGDAFRAAVLRLEPC